MKQYIKDDARNVAIRTSYVSSDSEDAFSFTELNNITIKQIKQIKIWERENPDYLQNEKLLTEWHTMIHNVMGSNDIQDRSKNKDSIKKEISMVVEVKNELI